MKNCNKVKHGSFLTNNLPDKSQQLIIADPPYYKVKGEFDFVWKTFDDYLEDVGKWAVECKRLLADNGSLLWYGDRKKIAYSQIILDKYFNLESNITIKIVDKQTNKIRPEDARCFINCSERLLMFSNEIEKTGLQDIYDNPDCFESIKKYMRTERDNLMKVKGFKTISKFNDFINALTDTKNVVSRHYFADSQYCFPVLDIYRKMQETGFWQREYEELRREYEELRREYEELRRPFNPVEKYKLDVLEFSQKHTKQDYIITILQNLKSSQKH